MDRTELSEMLKANRPNLTENSLKSYTSTLWNLNKKLFETDKINLEDLNNTEKVLEYLETKPIASFRANLSALINLTENPIYKALLMKKTKEYEDEKGKNEMNEKQQEQSISQDEILTKYKELETSAKNLYKKKDKITRDDKQLIQNYIIMSLMSGIHMPPRRLLDFTEMKINNIDKAKDNWIDFKKKKIYYNVFKNSKTVGQQIEELPKTLGTILKKWIKINTTDYMLFNVDGNKLSNVTLHDRVKNITGTNNNAFRHSFVSDKYQPLIDIKNNLKEDMGKMGSSVKVMNYYLQKKE